MAESFHSRFEPRDNMPDDLRETSLHSAAKSLNRDDDIPVVFPDDSLDYLWQLAYLLPRRGVMFLTTARQFIDHLAFGVLESGDANSVRELQDIRRRKEDAVANQDFTVAAGLRDQEDQLAAIVSSIEHRDVTRDDIVGALVRDGIDID